MNKTRTRKTKKQLSDPFLAWGLIRATATKKETETFLEKYEDQNMTTMELVAFAAIENGIDTNVDTDSIEEWEETLWAKLADKGITPEKAAQSWFEIFPDWFNDIEQLWLHVGSYGPDATAEIVNSTRAQCDEILKDHSRAEYKKLQNFLRTITHYTPIPSILKVG